MLGNPPGMVIKAAEAKAIKFDLDPKGGADAKSELPMHDLTTPLAVSLVRLKRKRITGLSGMWIPWSAITISMAGIIRNGTSPQRLRCSSLRKHEAFPARQGAKRPCRSWSLPSK